MHFDEMMQWFMSVKELCNVALATGKTIKTISESVLTQRERELLRSASEDGIFQLACNDIDGKFVFTSKREFTNSQDSAETAHWLDSFVRLCERGLVEHQQGEVFRLTGQGFDIARKLARK